MNFRRVDNFSGARVDKKVVLIVADGWGISARWRNNILSFSNPSFFNKLWNKYPHTVLHPHLEVIDRRSIIGNAEIGYASIGTGRTIKQDFIEINEAINSEFFYHNKKILLGFNKIKKFKSKLHVVINLSDGAIHSHIDHLLALLELAKNQEIKNVYVHVITDGVDVRSGSVGRYAKKLVNFIKKESVGEIASMIGRKYVIDENSKIFNPLLLNRMMSESLGNRYSNITEAIKRYSRKNIDESEYPPTIFNTNLDSKVSDFDCIIFANFNRKGVDKVVKRFVDLKESNKLREITLLTMTPYFIGDNVDSIFNHSSVKGGLSEIISKNNLNQCYIYEEANKDNAEYYFTGGNLSNIKGLDFVMVDSPKVSDYSTVPKMAVEKIKNISINAIKNGHYQFILVSLCNVNLVADTFNFESTVEAVRAADDTINEICKANIDGITIITSDHGNAEEIIDRVDMTKRDMIYTKNPVPFIVIDKMHEIDLVSRNSFKVDAFELKDLLSSSMKLEDVSPTILDLIGLEKSKNMTGKSILKNIGY